MDEDIQIECFAKERYVTWTCPHCGSVWSHDIDKSKACVSYLCHGTDKPYVIVLDRTLCLCCDGIECRVHWQNWNRRSITSSTRIPTVYAELTHVDRSHQTCPVLR